MYRVIFILLLGVQCFGQTYDTTHLHLDNDQRPDISLIRLQDDSTYKFVEIRFTEEMVFALNDDSLPFFSSQDSVSKLDIVSRNTGAMNSFMASDDCNLTPVYYPFLFTKGKVSSLGWLRVENGVVILTCSDGPFCQGPVCVSRYKHSVSNFADSVIVIGTTYSDKISQCTAIAGNDVAFCASDSTFQIGSDTLGGKPTASGGYPPYTYHWDISDFYSPKYVFKNLSDTSVANPTLFEVNDGMIYLTVTDSLGLKCRDTVKTQRSSFVYLTVVSSENCPLTLGDTTRFNSITFGGISPVTCKWSSTKYMLPSDTNSCFPRFVLDGSYSQTHFNGFGGVVMVDSIGCTASRLPSCNSYLVPVDETSMSSFSLFPNPATNGFAIELFEQSSGKIDVIDMFGRSVFVEEFNSEKRLLINQYLSPGTYSVNVFFDSGESVSSKLIVN